MGGEEEKGKLRNVFKSRRHYTYVELLQYFPNTRLYINCFTVKLRLNVNVNYLNCNTFSYNHFI